MLGADKPRAIAKAVMTGPARFMLRIGLTPNIVTIAGTIATIAAALWLFPTGNLAAGALVVGVLVTADSLDGTMARLSNNVSQWGSFLDSTLDRFSDAAIFAGLTLWFAGGGDDRYAALAALACLILGTFVPYARAKAESIGCEAKVGIAERADRLVVALLATLVVGFGAPVWIMTVVLSLLALAALITVIQRMATVHRQIRDRES